MQPKLRLVRDANQPPERAGESEQEERHRYPAHEEVWEVSCDADWEDDERPTRTRTQRRAS